MSSRLRLEAIQEAYQTIDPVFLNTPQFRCQPLEQLLGCGLLVKVETLNPIRSFKGRGASYLMSRQQPGQTVVCASAGNFGQAVAYAGSRAGNRSVVFASVHASPVKLQRMRELGAEVLLEGESFEQAKAAARRYADRHGFQLLEDTLDRETCEGAGTIGLELLRHPEPIDTVLLALGNGAMLTGTARWIKAHSPGTRVVGVVAAAAPVMAESYRQGRALDGIPANTIADGIAVTGAIPEVMPDLLALMDSVIEVREDSILRGMRLLHRYVGIVPEPSAAMGMAALLENPEQFRGRLVASVLCGGNLSVEQMREYLA